MDLTDKQNLQLLFKKHGLRPLKRFGQNFIIEKGAVEGVVSGAELDEQDVVLEIGPGVGTLTRELAKRAKRVLAVEKDPEMVTILKETLGDFKNIEVIQQDIRRLKPVVKNYKVVGNLPFYLTAPVIRMFLELSEARPVSMTLVVQKEVAQRICAQPPHMSILANAVQFYADPKIISVIPKGSFFPQPKVDAALIRITPRPAPMGDSKKFFEIVKAGFSHPRKQLLNNLAQGLKKSREAVVIWLQKNNVSPQQRAETLSVDDWLRLTVNC